jgi:hypothetical protein
MCGTYVADSADSTESSDSADSSYSADSSDIANSAYSADSADSSESADSANSWLLIVVCRKLLARYVLRKGFKVMEIAGSHTANRTCHTSRYYVTGSLWTTLPTDPISR